MLSSSVKSREYVNNVNNAKYREIVTLIVLNIVNINTLYHLSSNTVTLKTSIVRFRNSSH